MSSDSSRVVLYGCLGCGGIVVLPFLGLMVLGMLAAALSPTVSDTGSSDPPEQTVASEDTSEEPEASTDQVANRRETGLPAPPVLADEPEVTRQAESPSSTPEAPAPPLAPKSLNRSLLISE